MSSPDEHTVVLRNTDVHKTFEQQGLGANVVRLGMEKKKKWLEQEYGWEGGNRKSSKWYEGIIVAGGRSGTVKGWGGKPCL